MTRRSTRASTSSFRTIQSGPIHPEDAHELREVCHEGLCDDVIHPVPMSYSRFVSLLRWPNQQPTGRRPGEFYLEIRDADR